MIIKTINSTLMLLLPALFVDTTFLSKVSKEEEDSVTWEMRVKDKSGTQTIKLPKQVQIFCTSSTKAIGKIMWTITNQQLLNMRVTHRTESDVQTSKSSKIQ